MYELILSGEAYSDLVDIQNYTYTEFGEHQWEKYIQIIDNAFLQLQKHPFSGQVREDIPLHYSALNVGQHIIIFRIQKGTVYVIRVLHQRMDFTFRFQ
jgi:toxin ParE1/3/4